MFFKKQSEAIEHSFELASGLESQMIGETEILGQMKGFLKAKDSNFLIINLIDYLKKLSEQQNCQNTNWNYKGRKYW